MVALLRRDGVLGQVLIHGGGLTVRRRIVALGQGLRGNEEGVIQSWRAQRHWQPARTGEQRLGGPRHLGLAKLGNGRGRGFTPGLAHRGEDAGLRHTTKVALDRRRPAAIRHHVEPDMLGQRIRNAASRPLDAPRAAGER